MKRIFFLVVVFPLSAILFVAHVSAEGICTYRPPNNDEMAFFSHFAALREAVPPAPEGWMLRDNEKMDPRYTGIPDQVCEESNEHELELDVIYERKPDVEKDEETMQRALNAGPDKAELAKIEALQAKQLELAQQATGAAERGDYDAVDKINAEIDVLAERIQKMFDVMYSPQTEITAELERDRSASIAIVVNGRGGDCNGNPQPINIPGAVAYRCAYDDGYTSSGEVLDHAAARILIVLGQAGVRTQDWPRLGRDQREFTDQMLTLEAAYDRGQPLVVQNVVIRIDSDNPERVDGLFRGLRLDGLKNLVKR